VEIYMRLSRKLQLASFVLLALSSFSCKQSAKPGTPETEVPQPALTGNPIVTGTILKRVPPQYPAVAKAARVQGTVVLHTIIAEDGTVESLEAVSGPEIFRGAATDAVKQWVYKPYLVNGKPRRVDTTVTVNFQLTPPPTHP
jgi:TonB family protein